MFQQPIKILPIPNIILNNKYNRNNLFSFFANEIFILLYNNIYNQFGSTPGNLCVFGKVEKS